MTLTTSMSGPLFGPDPVDMRATKNEVRWRLKGAKRTHPKNPLTFTPVELSVDDDFVDCIIYDVENWGYALLGFPLQHT